MDLKSACIILLLANTAAAARQARSNGFSSNFQFGFDHTTGLFVGYNTYTCLIASLTPTERMDIQSGRGMENMELTMMRDWMGKVPEERIYHDNPMLSPTVLKWCSSQAIYFLQRSRVLTTTAHPPQTVILPVVTTLPNNNQTTPLTVAPSGSYAPSTNPHQTLNTATPSYNETTTKKVQHNTVTVPDKTLMNHTNNQTTLAFTNSYSTQSSTTAGSTPTVLHSDTTSLTPSKTTSDSTTITNLQIHSNHTSFTISTKATNQIVTSHFTSQQFNPTTLYTEGTTTQQGQTTSEVPATATSHHTRKVTTQSSVAPYVIYDSSSVMKAVIVSDGTCFVYQLSAVEISMVKMGQEIRDSFEKALLAMNRTIILDITGHVSTMDGQVKAVCTGKLFTINYM